MTNYPFIPSVTAPFQFQPTLDGTQYVATVKWNIASQRWYLFIDQVNGANVFTIGLTGSPTGVPVAAATFDEAALVADIQTALPHGYPIGATVELTIGGMSPDAWSGLFECDITGPNSFSYALASNPGMATQLGSVTYNVNLAAGYFQTSTLVWRPGAAQIEVSP